ncbi:alpha/beta hydrolase [Cellulomonas fimi]|uniref:Alpha/beta hydrolase n=1 Tax=Cellulomonas fimi TaxID=1708 RepID=A0A7Y0LX01_CELFI|nr:alpha/beta hydrolase [Cellulomonas fimi]
MLPDPVSAPPRARRRGPLGARTGVVVGVLALLLAGCTSSPKNQSVVVPPEAPATGAVEPGLEPFYTQAIEWTACDGFECATAQVPLDYAEPAAGSVELALKRAPAASGTAIGSLLVNPGGPGVAGIDLVDSAVETFGEGVLANYDVVGFDPRGVGQSTPIRCLDDQAKDQLISTDVDYSTDAGVAAATAAYAALGAACAANTGPLLGHVDTVSAARDLDVLRAALGDDALTYLGYSYGTLLGATYADLFPDRVGRLVLDGALDPTVTRSELALQQAVGFENALRAYVEDCQAGSQCPLQGGVDDGLAQVEALVERARRNPLQTESGRPLTGSLAFTGIALPLYDDALWGYLTQALTAAIVEDDGSVLLQLADIYNDRNPDGSFSSNSTEAFVAINCLDSASSADLAEMRAEAAEIEAAAPTVGAFFGYGGVTCAAWPYPPTGEPGPTTAEGAPPILVIGTTNDPATPYAWSEALAEQLSSGVLLTYEGEGHTAYGRSNDCILDAVDQFLLAGEVPADGTRC